MDFRPTDQQRLLVAVAREFLDKTCPPTVAEGLAAGGASDELWRRMSALGWPGLLVPARHGGSEASLLDVVVLMEEIGRAALPGPYVVSAVVSATILAAAGTRAMQDRVLPAIATGDAIGTLAILEDRRQLAPDAIALRVEPGAPLDGVKRLVDDAHVATHFLVVGRGAGGIGVALVGVDRGGIALDPQPTMSGDRRFDVRFSRVEIRPDMMLGADRDAWPVLERALALGAVARAAEMVGAAQRILDLAVEHAKVRVQSGRPIGSFQAIQHTCADLLRDVETARGLVHHAAWRIDTDREATTAVAMAKAYAAQACLAVARRAHQVFGALGYSAEHPLQRLHKRIHAGAVEYGDRPAHLETVARAIGLR